ncbi:MAG: nucleotide pyrophosphohydrolase [Zoogloeaceae bacterium]|jgi:NTP pyrophosphatase (non-canonical NTP hydrolase)|nr:nucleotide pyrophosphohydrolase [Zoogloeaceae bacterium]
MTQTLADLTRALLDFRDERNWAQFHRLKDLMLSLSLEAAEVLELAQWKRDEELEAFAADPEGRALLADECADVFAYLLLLADRAGIDLTEALLLKLAKNAEKYPVATSYGRSDKYSRLPELPVGKAKRRER